MMSNILGLKNMYLPYAKEHDEELRKKRKEAASFNRVIDRVRRSLSQRHHLPPDIGRDITNMSLHSAIDTWVYPQPPVFFQPAQYNQFRTENPNSEVIFMDADHKPMQTQRIFVAIFWEDKHCIAFDLDLRCHDIFYTSLAQPDIPRYKTSIVYFGDEIYFDFENTYSSRVQVDDVVKSADPVVVWFNDGTRESPPLRFLLYKT